MLKDLCLSEFSDVLASEAPAPGGGSAAALMGTLGAALVGMVAGLTVGNGAYAAHHAQMRQLHREALQLREQLLALVDSDSQAFDQVTAAYALPKGNPQEVAARRAAAQAALRACCETPLGVMRASLEALRLSERALEGYNASAASDLGVAALALGAAMRGAWLNVLINLGGIDDAAFAADFNDKSAALLAEALPISERVYQVLAADLGGSSVCC